MKQILNKDAEGLTAGDGHKMLEKEIKVIAFPALTLSRFVVVLLAGMYMQ